MPPVSGDAWLTLVVTLGTIVLLALDRYPPALVMGGAVTALLVSGVINEDGALAGFRERGARHGCGALHPRRGRRDVRLRTGDVLVIVSDPGFWYRWTDHPDFLVVTPLFGRVPYRKEKAWIVQALTVAMIAVAGAGFLSLLQASLLVAMALVVFGVITPAEAKRAVDLDVILLMATSFGLGIAMAESGLAEDIARLIVRLFDPLGDIGILGGVLIATMAMPELLSNNAAAVLMFPIAMATAGAAGLAFRPFAIAILFGATLSFLTPIGYQANTLVWGMGGYRYRDFSRLGAPLTVATLIAVVLLVPVFFPLR